MLRKYFVGLGAFLMFFAFSMQAEAKVYSVEDAKNIQETYYAKLQMIQQVKNSAEQIQYMLRNLERLDLRDLAGAERRLNNIFYRIESIRKQTDAIGADWVNTVEEWSKANPDYTLSTFNDNAKAYAEQAEANRKRWGKTLQQGLVMAGIANDRNNEETTIEVNSLLEKMSDARGTTQAIQVSGALNALSIAELKSLEAIVSEQLKVAVMAEQQKYDNAQAQDAQRKVRSDELAAQKDALLDQGYKVSASKDTLPHS